MRSWPCVRVILLGSMVFLGNCAAEVQAQEGRCIFLCSPAFGIEPTVTFENLFNPARVEAVGGDVAHGNRRQTRDTVFELVLVVGIPTEVPRVGFTVETIFVPFNDVGRHPFTEATAADLSRMAIRDNDIEVELELNLDWLLPEHTGGWVESHFDIVDKISRAERPGDTTSFTHKLNFELDTALLIFKWIDDSNWLHNLELEASFDYVMTGLPRAGDLVDGQLYFDDASPWSLSLVVVVPLAPLFP